MSGEQPTLCPRCGVNPATAPHLCPYQVDVRDDEKFQCCCCSECERECADEV